MNNWQVLAMYRNLNDILERGVDGTILLPEQLAKMTALELMELLAPNDVRFYIQKSKLESPIGDKLTIEHHFEESNYILFWRGEERIVITDDEMVMIINFVKENHANCR